MSNITAVSILEELQEHEVVALCQMLFKEAGSRYADQAWQPHQDNVYLNIKIIMGTQLNTSRLIFFYQMQIKQMGDYMCIQALISLDYLMPIRKFLIEKVTEVLEIKYQIVF